MTVSWTPTGDNLSRDQLVTSINDALAGKANTSHTHAIADVTGLAAALANTVSPAALTAALATEAAARNSAINSSAISTRAFAVAEAQRATAGMVAGLSNVDNTRDISKPVSTPQLARIRLAERDVTRIAIASDDRPGESPARFTEALPGEPMAKAEFARGSDVNLPDLGRCRVVAGAGRMARREPVALHGRVWEISATARRVTDGLDPDGDALSLSVAWLAQDKTQIGAVQVLATRPNFKAADGAVTLTARVSPLVDAAVIAPPAGAAYAVAVLDWFGADPAGAGPSTAIAALAARDVTALHFAEVADLSQLISETEDARDAALAASLTETEKVGTMAQVASYTRPADVGVILFCLGIGALTTSLPLASFLRHPETWRYLAANLSLMNFLQPNLPGALQDNHLTALNGSLWTIKVEVMLYVTVPFLCLFYRMWGQGVTLALCFFGALVWYIYFTYYFGHPLGPTIGHQFPGQMGYFVMGSVLGFVTLSRAQVALVTAIFVLYYVAARPLMPAPWSGGFDMILIALFVIAIAASPILSIGIGRFGDVSYGIYLFHFPIIQAAEHFKLNESYPIVTLIGIVALTLIMALLSWHLIEKQFLRRGSHYISVVQV
jgi:hypothetical protein